MQKETLEGFRLSPQQERLWLLQQGGPAFRAECVVELEGPLDAGLLREAWRAVVSRHEILRTTYELLPGMGLPVQVIGDDPAAAFALEETDLTGRDGDEQRRLLEELRRAERSCAFDLERGPVLRLSLARLSAGRHWLLVSLPALCADARTLRNMLEELARGYAELTGGVAAEAGETVQYVDYAQWQHELLEEAGAGDGAGAEGPEGAPGEELRLPGERRAASGFEPARRSGVVAAEVAARLGELSGRHGAPLAVLLLAAWQTLLWRLTKQPPAVELLFDGRKISHLRGALGLFASHAPVGCRFAAGLRFTEVLRRTGEAVAAAHSRREYLVRPAARGAEAAAAARQSVGFEFDAWPRRLGAGALTLSPTSHCCHTEPFKLKLSVAECGGALRFDLHYHAARLTEAGVARLAEEFEALLASVAERPEAPVEELDLLGRAERELVLDVWNRTEADYPAGACVHTLFERQAAAAPDAEAVVSEGVRLSYAELNGRANQLARRLRALGVGPDARVALLLERSAEMIVGLLGALKAGGAYVPLDPSAPPERLRFMLEDAGAAALVTRGGLAESLPAHAARVVRLDSDREAIARLGAEDLGVEVAPDNLAYVIYTSGSTGEPKGVMVQHRSVVNLRGALRRAVYDGLGPRLRVSLNAPLVFDASVKQVVQLLDGHALVIVPEGVRRDAEQMFEFVARERVGVLDCTPSLLRPLEELAAGGRAGPGRLRAVLVGGEELDGALWEKLAADETVQYFNVYGPTECTVDATARRVEPGRKGIGGPLPNVRAYLLDERMRPAPVGVTAELYVGGAGVARGYLNRPALTAERFVPDPFSGESGARLYRTGDLGHWLDDGTIEFAGRADHQVKLRGFRVEPGEIEAVLCRHPSVRRAVVVARDDEAGGKRLIAYAVPKPRHAASVEGRPRYELPNGMAVVHQNKNETDYLYEELFEKEVYVRHGIRLPEDACVFDVGANIGMFTLYVSRRCPAGRVYAFEPIAPIFEALRINADLYGANVKLFPIGLSHEERTESFTFYPRYSMMSGLSAYADAAGEVEVVKRYLRNEGRAGSPESAGLLEHADEILSGRFTAELCESRLRRLSDVIREEGVGRIDLLKVDVQRAELDVLRGLGPGDWEKIQQVVMEVHDREGGDSEGRVGEIRALLEARGYAVVAEQDELLVGTDRYNLYAWRPRPEGAAPDNGNRHAAARPAAGPAAKGRELLSVSDLREHLRGRLPEYMVPSAFVLLDALPLTPNGKVDRRALPAPDGAQAGGAGAPPRTPFEEMLAGVWAGLLGAGRVERDDNFFELGGHSLLATQVMSRVRKVFRVELPLRALFEAPTVAALAERVEAAVRAGHGLESPPVGPAPRDEPLPLSFAQRRLWFLDQLESGSPVYNCPAAIKLNGALDLDVLGRALSEIVRRHEVLRTRFISVDGTPAQVVAPPEPCAIKVVALDGLGPAEREAEAERLTREEARRPFDLAAGPPLRATLLRLSADEHVALFTTHHIVSDAWSVGVLVSEVAALYEALSDGRPSPLPELQVQYADYAAWQRDWLRGEALDRQLSYWKAQLEGAPPVLELPTDRPRPPAAGHRGAAYAFALPPALSEELKALSRGEGATLFMTLLAAFQVLLARYSGGDDVSVGTAIAGRNKVETEPLIGFFVNTLVLRARTAGNPTFREFLARAREVCLGAYAHQDVPFERLVEELQPERSLAHAPLFQVMFILNNAPGEPLRLPGLTLGAHPVEVNTTKFDLTLSMSEGARGLAGSLHYNTDLFDPPTVERMAGHFRTLLEGVVADPRQRVLNLPLLTAAERRRLVADFNETAREYPQGLCVHELFEAQAARTPGAVAVVCEGERLTYAELDARANQLARHLQSLGVGPEVRVGICLEHSTEMLVGLLGVFKAGGAYVGLDPAFTKERLRFMLEDAGARAVLTQRGLAHSLPPSGAQLIRLDADWPLVARRSAQKPACAARPENMAQLLYTSGSTGRPKGVAGEHRQLVNYVRGIRERLEPAPGASFATHHTLAVDALISILYPSLSTGGTLHLIARERATDPAAFGDYFGRHRIEYFKTAPSHMAALLAAPEPERVLPKRLLMLGGEASRAGWVEQLRRVAPGCAILNHYGPTETTCGVATYRVPAEGPPPLAATLPLSRPLPNSTIYILDAQLNPVPVGVTGEMHVGGAGVARGYLNRPALTAERFVPDPFGAAPGGRMYRTGDLAKFLPDGNVEFLGRRDHQIKIRGYRVELEEIQTVLGRHPGVRSAVLASHDDGAGDGRLVAYVVARAEPAPTRAELRDYLRRELPEFMIPATFVYLEKLPLTPMGKVDRLALPAPDTTRRQLEKPFRAPSTPTEGRLVEIWASVLRVERVGADDNFFELGGHSLLATRVVSRMREAFRVELPLRRLFERPTVAGVAAAIEEARAAGQGSAPPAPAIKSVARAAYRMKRSGLDAESTAQP